MALENIVTNPIERAAEYRVRRRLDDIQVVTPGAVADYEPLGWKRVKDLRRGVRISKEISVDQKLENRFWCCLYRLGYNELNRGRNFKISIADNVQKQVDVFAKDDETVVVAECKTALEQSRKSLQKDLGEFHANKKGIADSIRKHYGRESKLKIIWIFVIENITISQEDASRAKEQQTHILNARDLVYFEEIAKSLGPAARVQFKADFLSGLDIPALENKKIPAVKTRLGGHSVFAFSSKASDVLKIAFVNHRDLRDPSSAPTYQRLVNPSRLKKITSFLESGGYFPNSILLNFQKRPRFDISLHGEDKDIQFGYLHLPSKYKSLKVIDGQHRLYGCAVLNPAAHQPNLFFIAFEHISGDEEANLFATINKEQQKVQKRLLDELDGELKWESPDVFERVKAIASRAVDLMNASFGSPFEDKVLSPGLNHSDDCPLTLPEIRK